MFENIFKILSSDDVRGVFHVFSGKWVRSSIALSLLLYTYGVFKNTASFIAKGEYVSIITYYIDSDLATKTRQTTYMLRSNYIKSLKDKNIYNDLIDTAKKDRNKAFYIPFYILYCMDGSNRNAFLRDKSSVYDIEALDKVLYQPQTNVFCEFTRNNYHDDDFYDYVNQSNYDWKLWLIPKYATKHVIDTAFCGAYGLLLDTYLINNNFSFERNHSCNVI